MTTRSSGPNCSFDSPATSGREAWHLVVDCIGIAESLRSCSVPPGTVRVRAAWEPQAVSAAISSRGVTVADSSKGLQRRFVSIRQSMQVFLSRTQAAVAEALLHYLQVGATGEEPGRMRVPEVVDPYPLVDPSCDEGGLPDALTEPPAWNVTVGVETPPRPRIVLPVGAALCSVVRVRGLAVFTAASAQRVAGQSPVPVPPPSGVGLGPAERVGVRQLDHPSLRGLGGRGEQEVVHTQVPLADVG